MTIRVEITAETPEQYGALVLALAGGARLKETMQAMIAGFLDAADDEKPATGKWEHQTVGTEIRLSPEYAEANSGVIDAAIASGDLTPASEAPAADPAPVRRRRTKAEIEAARAAEAPAPLATQVVNRAISETPEDRVGPQDVAAPAAGQPEPTPTIETVTLNHDDVRRALKVVVDNKGMPVATEALMGMGYGKASDVPAEKIAEVIAILQKVAA